MQIQFPPNVGRAYVGTMRVLLKDAENGLWLGENGCWQLAPQHSLEFATAQAAINYSRSCGPLEVNICFSFENPGDDFEIGSQRRWLPDVKLTHQIPP